MAVNVTEKDKTLNEIIDWCEQMESDGLRLASALLIQHDMAAYGAMQGQISAYEKTAEQEKNLWRNMGTCDAQGEWLDKARDLLEIARKAVNE